MGWCKASGAVILAIALGGSGCSDPEPAPGQGAADALGGSGGFLDGVSGNGQGGSRNDSAGTIPFDGGQLDDTAAAEADAAADDAQAGGDAASTDGDTAVVAADSDGGQGDDAPAPADSAAGPPDAVHADDGDGGSTSDASAADAGAADVADAGDGAGSGDSAGDAAPADATPAEVPVVRFAALGDTGTGTETQYKVGKALAAKCKQSGCDFVLLLGDNFYDTGVKDENDKQFVEKFEKPYADVEAPFYVVLGNHDYGSGGAGAEFMKKDHYIAYGKKNPKWILPAPWWHKQVKHVHLFALDSNTLLYGDVLPLIIKQQLTEMDEAIAKSTATWKITYAHHPMRSNGPHGNAGCYEGAKAAPIPQLCGIIPVASGKGVLEAYQKLICGRVDVHLSGHDHGRQWIDKAASNKHCQGVELLVSGGGAKVTHVESKSKGGFEFNPVHWQNGDYEGFLWVEIKGDTFKGEFIDADGKLEFSRSFERGK